MISGYWFPEQISNSKGKWHTHTKGKREVKECKTIWFGTKDAVITKGKDERNKSPKKKENYKET